MKGAIAAAGDVAGRVMPGIAQAEQPAGRLGDLAERRRADGTRSLIASTKALRSVGNAVMHRRVSVSASRLSPGAT